MKPKLGNNSSEWIFNHLIRTTGKAEHWEFDAVLNRLPPEVRTWAMIPKFYGKQAARQEEFARKAEASGHPETAWEGYLRACENYFNAQHAICEDDNAEKIRLYDRLLHCHARAREHSRTPIEKVEIPWGEVTLPAMLHLLPDKKKASCVLYIRGMDQCKEMYPITMGNLMENHFMARGMHVLILDGPGQGECNLRKIRVRPDNHREAATAAIDYLLTRPEIDGKKICLYGASMGTYWGAHIAAHDSRIKACVLAIGCFMMRRHTIFEEASPKFRLIYKYMAGIEDDHEFDEMVAGMTLQGVGANIKCPTLIMVGEYDPLSPSEETDAFFDEIAGPKEMWVFEDEFHTAFNRGLCNVNLNSVVADWFRDAFTGKVADELNRRVSIAARGTGPG